MAKVRVFRILFPLLAIVAFAGTGSAQPKPKLGPQAERRANQANGVSRVIVTVDESPSGADVESEIGRQGGGVRRRLGLINGYVADLPNGVIKHLAEHAGVKHISLDRLIVGANERTGATVGATAVRQELGFDGSGVGVAVIDSGITPWHDDLGGGGTLQRVERFVNFVDERPTPHDDYGHGTHVAGIIAGNGTDSSGRRSGIAPNASLIVLKVLDAAGHGRISDVIAALDYVVAHKDELNIRVVNLSVATGVYESYDIDPLTLAAERAVANGIVVVAAAGNYGRDAHGRKIYGGAAAPGNAPWVLTVGASSHMGTADRADDRMATFSSRGPTAVDFSAKPDLVAPGVGIESLSDPDSTFYTTQAPYLLEGTVPTSYLPYLSQSGTSMASPVVAGTVALMLQANPFLTPNQVKAILQYTAEVYAHYDPLTEGAGFLNARGAVDLARTFGAWAGAVPSHWSRRLIWGNRLVKGGVPTPEANAWLPGVTWGDGAAPDGQEIEWGLTCDAVECDTLSGGWRMGDSRNVVWGSRCGGANCVEVWRPGLFGSSDDDDTVVWGTSDDDDTVVWGTSDDDDTVVWGTSDDDDTVVWGTSCTDPGCAPVVWQP